MCATDWGSIFHLPGVWWVSNFDLFSLRWGYVSPLGALYRKIRKKKPRGLYFSKAIFERLIIGGAYARREICVWKSIGLAFFLEGNLPFFFVLLYIWRKFLSTSTPDSLYLDGRFNGGFFALRVWGAYIWRGLYMEGLIFGILRYLSSYTQTR